MTAEAGALPTTSAAVGERELAFRAFYVDNYSQLAGYCYRLSRDPDLAADTAQEALTRLYGRWRSVAAPKAWTYLVATNLLRDHWARAARERAALGDLAGSRDPCAPAADVGVRDLVERLPRRLRDAVLLHYYADLPIDEVARVLHRPTGSIKQRLHEARTRLAEQMGDADE